MNKKEKIKEKLWCEALSSGHTMRYKAIGGSMRPFIKRGDILSVEATNRISIGNVILYKRGEYFTAHRVVGRRRIQGDRFFLTKGDASASCDSLVDPSEVVGKVVAIKTRKRKIVKTDSFSRGIFDWGIAVISLFVLPRMLRILKKVKALVSKNKQSNLIKQADKENVLHRV